MNPIDFLGRIDFLDGAPRELLERIAQDLERIEVRKDTEIFADGEPGDAMYFIVEGSVRIEKRRQTLLQRTAGEYVGEMALVDDAPRSAAVIAATDVVLLLWKKDSFESVLESSGRIAYQICRAISTKLRESVESATSIKQDLERAVQVQRAMLPEDSLVTNMVTLSARCLQAEEIGGDYFDYLPFDDDQLFLFLADVQGHGFAPALLVAMLKTRLHSRVARRRAPNQVMAALHQTLRDQVNDIQMVTGIYVLLDSKTHELRYCNAGHIPQYHYRAQVDELDVLTHQSPILGFPGQGSPAFQTTVRTWAPDDLLVLCTDGVTEAENPEGEEFGKDRLAELIFRHRSQEPDKIRQELFEALESFHGSRVFKDDVTLLVARLS